jgi:hypothetical protein
MKHILRRIRELIEASEPDTTVVELRRNEPFACPIGLALWQEHRRRNPDGLKVPPVDLMDCTDPELMPYAEHVDSCDDCNEV